MGISMSEAQLTHDSRDTLLSSTVEGAKGGGIFGGGFSLGAGGANLAGITPEFATAVKNAIDNYINKVTTALNQLQSVDSNAAFQGTGVTQALVNFVDGVKEVANSYVTALQQAENQIMESVHTVYSTQDTDLQGQVQGDTSNLESQKVNIG